MQEPLLTNRKINKQKLPPLPGALPLGYAVTMANRTLQAGHAVARPPEENFQVFETIAEAQGLSQEKRQAVHEASMIHRVCKLCN